MQYLTLRETHLEEKTRGKLKLVKPGKVRDVYERRDKPKPEYLFLVHTDRISCYDVILPSLIPRKGEGLCATSEKAFYTIDDMSTHGELPEIPHHMVDVIDSNVMVVEKTKPIPVEMVVRGFLAGSAWRAYEKGKRTFFGKKLPIGLKKNQKLKSPILTPATKAEKGHHDVDLESYDDLKRIVKPQKIADRMMEISLALYKMGNSIAQKRNHYLVDTKYEFGLQGNMLFLIDELHTHDSSRYVNIEDHKSAMREARDPDWIDKEFVRDWLMKHGFSGEGEPPELPAEIIEGASNRVLQVYKIVSGEELEEPKETPTDERILKNLETKGWV